MDIFSLMKNDQQEQIVFYSDRTVQLRAILAIHSTTLGPAIGGIRLMEYQTEQEAVFDLIRLSKAMTYKAAAAGLNFGGGQIVIIDNHIPRSEATFRAVGRFIESLKGRFIAAEDVGVIEDYMEYMRLETRYVSGLPSYFGGSGNHSSMCALGAFIGIKASAFHRWQVSNLKNRKIVVQGYGRTGQLIAGFARDLEGQVVVSDIDPIRRENAIRDGFPTLPHDQVYSEKCDIFSPCAVGGIINSKTTRLFNCEIIAGTANNQLLNEEDETAIKHRGILYAPDFIINAGGLIDISEEFFGYQKERVLRKTENIYQTLLKVYQIAETKKISNHQAAIKLARERIDSIKNIRGTFLSKGKI
ncbi:MAG: Glu/Leu/Phe/Val dehydrogenase [Candidatus Delongbacteria bacterium]|nr:Glu/Leu/Phe/Val dehydrogenase [Candidatus Delongbacteria bacterium]